MKNLLLRVIFLLSIGHLALVIGHSSSVQAQNLLRYPIPDLGYCRDAKECFLYCEIPQNKATCWSYGKYKVGSDVLGVTTTSEEEKKLMEAKAKQLGITFPIADLGSCAGVQECRDFCEQPTNQQTCMDFAQKKGFNKQVERPGGIDAQKRDELLQKAKTELGCTSMESCSQVCQTDHSRCEAFAKQHGVNQEPPESRGRYSTEEKMQLMEKAKTELGCTSMESCKSTCEQNPKACMSFAKKHGFDKGPESTLDSSSERQYGRPSQSSGSANFGIQRFGKGSCGSEESCKKYCEAHPDECPGFKGYTRALEGSTSAQMNRNNYVGPSGCRNEAECKSWCDTNPDKCPGFSEAKTREETTKREYELKKKSLENQQLGKSTGTATTAISTYDQHATTIQLPVFRRLSRIRWRIKLPVHLHPTGIQHHAALIRHVHPAGR
ncbi:hypothetical protein HY031_01610 [Candidatus Gottesmanbacteria bacterium]|nr:hypothetical protein [Candidatus Gottesmanbacteria bacterium]